MAAAKEEEKEKEEHREGCGLCRQTTIPLPAQHRVPVTLTRRTSTPIATLRPRTGFRISMASERSVVPTSALLAAGVG